MNGDKKIPLADVPEIKKDTEAFTIEKIFIDEDGDKAVVLNVNSLNGLVRDSRSIMPDNPDLYFSLVASTSCYSANSFTTKSHPEYGVLSHGHTEVSGEADTTSAGSLGNFASHYYPLRYINADDSAATGIKNSRRMSGLTLTLKVGKGYFFTVYGTYYSPYEISTRMSNSTTGFGGIDHTKDTIYKVENYIGTNVPDEFYKYRSILFECLADESVVRGTSCYFIDEENGNLSIYYGKVSNGKVVKDETKPKANSIRISSLASSGLGRLLAPIKIENTTDLNEQKLMVESVRLMWTNKNDTSKSAYVQVDGINGIESNFVLFPLLDAGEYDIDIVLLNSDRNDILTIHDSALIWNNQVSYLLGKSSFYINNDSGWSSVYAASNTNTSKDSDNLDMESVSQLLLYDYDSLKSAYNTLNWNSGRSSCSGFNFTKNNITSYMRTVFFVSGGGGVLPKESDESLQDGSLFHPYDTLQEAVDAITLSPDAYKLKYTTRNQSVYNHIKSRQENYGKALTDWCIVVDGELALSKGGFSFTNTVETEFNLSIRNFASARVVLKDNFYVVNSVSDDQKASFNLYLTNVDWGAYGKVFTAGTNVYLYKTSLASDINTYQEMSGATVTLNKSMSGSSDGVFYTLVSDNSSVCQLRVDNVLNGSEVLRYDYVNVEQKPNKNSMVFTDFTSDASVLNRFKLSSLFSAAGVRSLAISSEFGDSYGCVLLSVTP